jgi:signal peptidase I
MAKEMDETTNPAPKTEETASEAITSEYSAPPATIPAPEDASQPADGRAADPQEVAAPVVPSIVSSAAPSRRQSAVDLISMWLGNLVVSLLTAAFVVIFLYQPVKVEGTSMLPGLEDQERIFVNRFVYRLEPISRGDVIVFRYPRDTSKSYIKRVIGIAGDRIHIVDGIVYVNGEPLSEDYVPMQYSDLRSVPELTVPQGYYFMMGDHRNMSSDSRDFGPVAQKFVVGKAVFGYWPFEKLGKVK